MNTFITLFNSFFPDPRSARLAFTAFMAAALFLLGLALLFLLLRTFDPVRKRLDSLRNSGDPGKPAPPALFQRYAAYFVPQDEKARRVLGDRLAQAGIRGPNRIALYYFARVGFMLALPAAVLILAPAIPKIQQQGLLAYLAGAALVGMIAPSYYLDKRVARRQRLLRNALPDAIDLLVVCTEAGLGLNAALLRVAGELNGIHPEFADELSIVNAELRAGVDRDQALRNLAQRTGLEDIKGLVALLAQSMRFGTSIAQTLRVYAEEFRDKRMQQAEENAAKLATKLIFPMIFCFFPGFFVVAIGPAVLALIDILPTVGH